MDLQTKLKNLQALRKGMTGADADALTIDIRNVERALDAEREMRTSVNPHGAFPPQRPAREAREVRLAAETDEEFRKRAALELERVPQV